MDVRIIAVDWSGAKSGAARKIWLAEVIEGEVVRLESGRDRDTITGHLIEECQRRPNVVIGLDFAFSLPDWYLSSCGLDTGHALWERVEQEGDKWLDACEPPFWGRPGRRKPDLAEHFRRTELDTGLIAGIHAKSVFQIGGAGAVGTGSLRGMPMLAKLHRAGASIWQFDAPKLPMVVEIYPRTLTGQVTKNSAAERLTYLETRFGGLSSHIRDLGASSEDAFDALVSALVMDEAKNELLALPDETHAVLRREGVIWTPMRSREARSSRGGTTAPLR